MAERLDDLAPRGLQPGLRQVVAEEVDRRHQRLRLEREQPGRTREVVAVGVGVDLDPVAGDLRVEDVGAAAEVDDVEHVEVLAQLVERDVELAQHLIREQALVLACGPDQQPGQGHEAREALRPDHGLRAPVRPAPSVAPPALGEGPLHGFGDPELVAMAVAEQRQALLGLGGQLGRVEQARVLAPGQHPGDQLARGGVLGLEDHPAAPDAVLPAGFAQLPVAAEVALHQPRDPLAQEHLRRPLDLAHLPVGALRVVAAVEVLGRAEVVLGLGGVGDLAPDPREAEDPDLVALVGVADQIELPVPEDEVVGVDLAVGDVVALERVVGELDRLAARDRGLDLRQALGELASAAGRGELDVDRRLGLGGERARAAPGDLLQRQPQRLGVGELAVEQAERGAECRELGVGELDRRQVVVLRRQRVELGLEEALGRLLDLQQDPEALELSAVGVEAPRERVLVHRAVALHLPLDLERRHRAPVRHQERDQRELSDQLLGVLRHAGAEDIVRAPTTRRVVAQSPVFATVP